MSREAAYSAGDKVYGAGRPHPTSGPVDPTGYVERSMNKQSSNRRSGLAAAAGRRLQGSAGMPAQQPAQPGMQPGQQPGVVRPQPSYAAPIMLPDGRKVHATATGQYKFIENDTEGGM